MTDRRAIQVGDLVLIVRGHSCVIERKTGPYVVVDIVPQINGGWHCPICNVGDIAPEAKFGARFGFHKNRGSGIPLEWLKRIPPLDELESTRTEEQIKEPA